MRSRDEAREARARRNRKKVLFLSLPIPSSFLSLILSFARGRFQGQKPTTRSLPRTQIPGVLVSPIVIPKTLKTQNCGKGYKNSESVELGTEASKSVHDSAQKNIYLLTNLALTQYI